MSGAISICALLAWVLGLLLAMRRPAWRLTAYACLALLLPMLAPAWTAMLESLFCMLLVFPASLVFCRRFPMLGKVVTGWLTAIALLSAALACLPVSPGYFPDHLE